MNAVASRRNPLIRARALTATTVATLGVFAAVSLPASAAPSKVPPGTPTKITVRPLDRAFAVSWAPPASAFSEPPVYKATAKLGTLTVSCSTANRFDWRTETYSCLIRGISNPSGKNKNKYKVSVTAQNSVGWGKAGNAKGTFAGLPAGANLAGTNLATEDLSLLSLADANFMSANLEYANFTSAYLQRADLRYAYLRYAVLTGADLRYANLFNTDLSDANLGDANLRYANLRYAVLTGADLSFADLLGVDLTGADLSGAYLYGAICPNGIFHGEPLADC